MVVIKKSPERVKFLRIRSKCVKSKVVMFPLGRQPTLPAHF